MKAILSVTGPLLASFQWLRKHWPEAARMSPRFCLAARNARLSGGSLSGCYFEPSCRSLPSGSLRGIAARILLTAIAIVAFCPGRGDACGVNWSAPTSHFDGVDYQGNVMFVENLGEIDAGQGLKIPLYAIFASNSSNPSPYAGYGWTVPLLEAKFVQVDEKTFKLSQPDGWYRLFWRRNESETVLNGQGGWKAEIRGDIVTAWASCGSSLVFKKGRLISMRLENRKIDLIYRENQVAELKEGGTVILRVETEPASGIVSGFRLADQREIKLERTLRPRLRMVGDQSLQVGVNPSLGKVVRADGSVLAFDYGTDEKLNPTLKVGEKLMTWNTNSKKVLSDGEWNYEVKPGKGAFDYAAIARKNAAGLHESWFRDEHNGREIKTFSDGRTEIERWFVSGPLDGQTRSKTLIRGKAWKMEKKYVYSERSSLLRVEKEIFKHSGLQGWQPDEVTISDYSEDGRLWQTRSLKIHPEK